MDFQAKELATPVSGRAEAAIFAGKSESRKPAMSANFGAMPRWHIKYLETEPVRGMIGRAVQTTHQRAG